MTVSVSKQQQRKQEIHFMNYTRQDTKKCLVYTPNPTPSELCLRKIGLQEYRSRKQLSEYIFSIRHNKKWL